MALAAGAVAQAFPQASAKLLWEATHPAPAGLTGAVSGPSAKRVEGAERRLRETAKGTGRNAGLAAFGLGEALLRSCGASQGADFARCAQPAAAYLMQAAEVPALRDAATARLVALHAQAQDWAATVAAADKYPIERSSPFYAAIARLAGPAAGQAGDWTAALRWAGAMPDGPAALWLRAQAEAGLGNARQAAIGERELIVRYPNSSQAQLATPLWQTALQAMPELALDWKLRAEQASAWRASGAAATAAREHEVASGMAPERERARLLAEAARDWMAARNGDELQRLLTGLLKGTERAQGFEIEVEWARKQRPRGDMDAPLAVLASEFPQSRWRARGLHEAGDQSLVELDVAATGRYFGELCRDFPDSAYAPNACWQAAWSAYRQNLADAGERMDAYRRQFPTGNNVVDALYWRGQWDAAHGEKTAARRLWREAARKYPGTYFGGQAAEALGIKYSGGGMGTGQVARAARLPKAVAGEVARADWMRTGGLLDAAAAVMTAALRRLPAGHASLGLARTLAGLDSERGDIYGGLLAMLRAVPDQLRLQPDALTAADWRRLYPRAYAADVEAVAERDGLDRDLLWGLIRQESAFDANSISSARARGLMQLELATARGRFGQLPKSWRALADPGHLSAQDLLNPGLNVALGAAELKGLLGQFGETAYALAGYNAGPGRMAQWRTGMGEMEVNSFIESIPFAQTREYVQAVLRNRDHYRWIYRRH